MRLMKKYISIIAIFGLIGCLLSSCSEYFSPGADNFQEEGDNFKNYTTSRASVNGLYTQMQDLMDAYVVQGELRGDMLSVSDQAGEDLQAIYDMELNPENAYSPRRQAFKVISGCNDVLTHFEELLEQGTTYDEQLRHMQAEVTVLRSWTYFFLLRTYDQVPYITSDYAADNTDQAFDKWVNAQASNPVTIDKLVSSVNSIIGDLDPSRMQETSFFNLASAYGLLGEMYLWNDQYNQAASSLQQAIHVGNGERFILDADLEESAWANIFKGDETANDEIITKIVFNKGEKQENELLPLFSSIAVNGPQLKPAPGISEWFETDHRKQATLFQDSEVAKYTRNREHGYQSDMPVILYRAADLHLMLAEAHNRMHNFDTALDLLNNGSDSLFTPSSKGVRGRVDLGSVTAEGADDQQRMLDLEDKILQERAREMAFEGKRWFDILRIAQRRNDPDMIVERMKTKYPESYYGSVENFYQDPANWYFPFK